MDKQAKLNNETERKSEITAGILNSIALFIYHAYPNGFGELDAVDIYNEWAECGVRFTDATSVCDVLDHIRKLMKVDRNDLGKALEYDGLGLRLEEFK